MTSEPPGTRLDRSERHALAFHALCSAVAAGVRAAPVEGILLAGAGS